MPAFVILAYVILLLLFCSMWSSLAQLYVIVEPKPNCMRISYAPNLCQLQIRKILVSQHTTICHMAANNCSTAAHDFFHAQQLWPNDFRIGLIRIHWLLQLVKLLKQLANASLLCRFIKAFLEHLQFFHALITFSIHLLHIPHQMCFIQTFFVQTFVVQIFLTCCIMCFQKVWKAQRKNSNVFELFQTFDAFQIFSNVFRLCRVFKLVQTF